MASRTKTNLKSYFNSGDIPTEENFVDLIDTGLYIVYTFFGKYEIHLFNLNIYLNLIFFIEI